MSEIRLSFHTFPTTWGIIRLSKSLHFFKAEGQPESTRYYNLATACAHATKAIAYTPSNELKVIDIRVLRYILLETHIRELDSMSQEDAKKLKKCMIALGLFGFYEQKIQYYNRARPIEHFGSILDLDDECIDYLTNLFGQKIQGYICPNIDQTQTHHICIFKRSDVMTQIGEFETADVMEVETNNQSIDINENEKYLTYAKMPRITMVDYMESLSCRPFNRIVTMLQVDSGAKKGGKSVKKGGAVVEFESEVSDVSDVAALSAKVFTIEEGLVDGSQDIWGGLEQQIEVVNSKEVKQLEPILQCELSKSPDLKNFIGNIFILITCILHQSLNTIIPDKAAKASTIRHTINYHYRPILEHRDTKNPSEVDVFVVQTGMARILTTKVVDNIIEMLDAGTHDNIIQLLCTDATKKDTIDKEKQKYDEIIKILNDNYTLSEILGAIYKITTHAGMFSLIYQACILDKGKDNFLSKLQANFEVVLTNLKSMFGLPDDYKDNELLQVLETNTDLLKNTVCDETYFTEDNGKTCKTARKKGKELTPRYRIDKVNIVDVSKNNLSRIVLDMMITQNVKETESVSLVRRNLNNQEYIRKRREKQIGNYKYVTKMSDCPGFYQEPKTKLGNVTNIMMVNGDEWYEVVPNGLFENVMKKYNRTCKAGPSGSTMMLMNMVFGLLGNFITQNDINQKKLLLCIISDFVPVFHSLTEVLMIYSREYVQTPVEPPAAATQTHKQYTIDQNPVEWLANHFEISKDGNMTVKILATKLLEKTATPPAQGETRKKKQNNRLKQK